MRSQICTAGVDPESRPRLRTSPERAYTNYVQGRWARQRQALFMAAHVFNPALRYAGLNTRCPSTTMMTQINALVELYKAVLGCDLDPAVVHSKCTDLVTQAMPILRLENLELFLWLSFLGSSHSAQFGPVDCEVPSFQL